MIFLSLDIKSFKTVLTLSCFSINGCPTNVLEKHDNVKTVLNDNI